MYLYRLTIFRRLCVDHDNVRPDIIILGKALSGGMYPVSNGSLLPTGGTMITLFQVNHLIKQSDVKQSSSSKVC